MASTVSGKPGHLHSVANVRQVFRRDTFEARDDSASASRIKASEHSSADPLASLMANPMEPLVYGRGPA